MLFIIFSMLYLQCNGFLQRNKVVSNKGLFSSLTNNLYKINPYNTIIYYDLNYEKKIEIQMQEYDSLDL